MQRLKNNENANTRAKALLLDSVGKAKHQPNEGKYPGTYRDTYFGDINITLKNDKLWFASQRSPQLKGYLLPYKKDIFYIKWQNPEIDGEALVNFKLATNGQVCASDLEAAIPNGGSNFDGLLFVKMK